jgi:hypothetical protein
MKCAASMIAVLVVGVSNASAQTAPLPRAFVVVNGGYQVSTNNFDDGATFRANAEDGEFTTDYEVKGGPSFDVAGGARVWRWLAVGAGVTRFSRSTPTVLNGTIPHPFFFSRPRSIDADVSGLKREELAVHIQAQALAPIGKRFQVAVFGGPSLFHVKQGLVRAFTWTDSYPYDAATFTAAQTAEADGTSLGFNVGGDFAFFFTRQIGVGGTLQFSQATVEMSGAGDSALDVKAGGAKAGGGLRLRF